MREALKGLLYALLNESKTTKRVLSVILRRNVKFQKILLQLDYLEQTIRNQYSEQSLKEKRLYNIGAGNQRSKYNFWSYLDLKSDTYDHSGIDLLFNLESIEPLPIEDNKAEVIFNSFVIEHISKEATKNLAKEAHRALKKGGVFHSKIHCFDYGLRLMNANLISPKIPFEGRENRDELEDFIANNDYKVETYYEDNAYVVQSKKNPEKKISFNPEQAFLNHNAVAAIPNLQKEKGSLKESIDGIFSSGSISDGYKTIRDKFMDASLRMPHQHNADYWGQEEFKSYLLSLGYSEVYFTQPYQSVSSALWEEKINPLHFGFVFAVEAIK